GGGRGVNVLIVGGGAREHALWWRLAQDPSVDRVLAAPGNPGIEAVASVAPVVATDVPGLVDLAVSESVDLTVVGPEASLVAGLADELAAKGLPVFGPTAEAARLEGSKAWARALCERHGIPVPRSGTFDDAEAALGFLELEGRATRVRTPAAWAPTAPCRGSMPKRSARSYTTCWKRPCGHFARRASFIGAAYTRA